MTETYLGDTLTNLIKGMGTGKDSMMSARFVETVLSQEQIDALYNSDWVAGTLVDAQPEDETREWREWQGNAAQIEAMETVEGDLDIRTKLREVRQLARKDGGSALLLGTGDRAPEKPLRLDSIGKGGLKYVHVLSTTELTCDEIDRDPRSIGFGRPSMYRINGARDGAVPIHPSRVVVFTGRKRMDGLRSHEAWGVSVLQRMFDTILAAATAAGNVASLTNEAKVDMFKVPGLTQNARDPQWREQMLARFVLVNMNKSLNNGVLIDSEEEWEQKTINFAGLPEVVRLYAELCAGSGGMPVSRLMGKAPSGLNSGVGGDAETRAWYDKVSAGQKTDLQPVIRPLDEALMRHALGTRPRKLWYEWAPLWQLTEGEKADIALKNAQATEIYASGKFFAPTALRKMIQSQLSEAGVYPGMDEAVAAAGAEEPAPLIEKAPPKPPAGDPKPKPSV